MQEEQHILREIEEVEQRSNHVSAGNHLKQEQITADEISLGKLQQHIDELVLPEKTLDLSIYETQITSLKSILSNFDQQLDSQNHSLLTEATRSKSELAAVQLEHHSLTAQNQTVFTLDKKQLEHTQAQLEILHKGISKENAEVQAEKAGVSEQKQKLSGVSEDLKKLTTLQQAEEESVQTLKRQYLSLQANLLKELSDLELVLQEVHQQAEEANKSAEAAEKEQKNAGQALSIKLVQERAIHDALKQQSNNLAKRLHQVEHTNLEAQSLGHEKDQTLANIERDLNANQSEIDNLIKINKIKKEELKREDERIAEEKKKAQKRKNYKELIRTAEIENSILLRTQDNEERIYKSTINSKNTYASRQNLDILLGELHRQQNPNTPALQFKTNELDKLQRTNRTLNDKVKKLKRLNLQSETKQSKLLSDSKQSLSQLLSDKAALEQQFANANFKVNEYTKRFPNHQQEKVQKKKIKMQRTESIVRQPKVNSSNKDVKKKDEQSEFIILDDKEEDEGLRRDSEGSTVFKKTKWYKRRSSSDFELPQEKAFYQNPYIQGAAGVLLLLLVTVLNF